MSPFILGIYPKILAVCHVIDRKPLNEAENIVDKELLQRLKVLAVFCCVVLCYMVIRLSFLKVFNVYSVFSCLIKV